MAVEIILAVFSSGLLGLVVAGLIRLGRILERQDSVATDVDEIRSMQDAQSDRLTRHIDSHWQVNPPPRRSGW